MVDPVEVQCSLSCNLVHLFHVLRECYYASPPLRYAPLSSSKRLAEISFEANKRLKESPDCELQKSDDRLSCLRQTCKQEDCIIVKRDFEDESSKPKVEEVKGLRTMRRRPSKLFIPEPCSAVSGFGDDDKEKNYYASEKELEVKGRGYSLVSRRGYKSVMEDGSGVILNINGDPKQAFFGVFDGHGGREAVDFVSKKLGKNIISALAHPDKDANQPEMAIKAGYLATDSEFISQGVKSGACAATVLLKDGELHAANVGDCRVVLSRKGKATALTSDHNSGREDERNRIESSGGYVTCRNGVWRVQDSLAVSRSIGDVNLKEWIISEPETKTMTLTPDCEFLVMASDGLWNKVTNQEAVDAVVNQKEDSMKACSELVELSCSRGSRDDITVMVVNLQDFVR